MKDHEMKQNVLRSMMGDMSKHNFEKKVRPILTISISESEEEFPKDEGADRTSKIKNLLKSKV